MCGRGRWQSPVVVLDNGQLTQMEIAKMPMRMLICVLPLLITTALWAADDAALPLVTDGRSEYVIVLAKDASPSEKWAAQEFRSHIQQMSGAELQIQPEQANGESPARSVIIGDGPAARALIADFDRTASGDEGFVIRTVGTRLVIAGGRLRGTMYGVYTLLDSLGVRWWTPSETFIPQMPTIRISPQDRSEKPGLAYRDMMSREIHGEAGHLWMARNRMNGMIWQDADEKIGGRYSFGGRMLAHTIMKLAQKHKVALTPEMMSMDEKGERAKPGSRGDQLCFTNPAVIEAMASVVVAEYQADPTLHFVMLGQEDGNKYCHCPGCQKVAEREGSQSGPVIHFANAVAAKAEETVPGAAVAVNAYVWSRLPPRHLRPRPNVYVVLASYEVDFGTPLADSRHQPNLQFKQDLEQWNAITTRIYMWDYMVNFLHYLMPQPNLDVLVPNIRYYAAHGVAGIMSQGAWDCWYAEMAPLRGWVIARAMWNPESDGAALIDDFVKGYYGPAAGGIADYIDATHRFVRENPEWVQGIYRHTNSRHIAPDIIAEAEAAMQKAQAAARESGDETIIKRVAHAHMPLRYVMLKMGPRSPMWRAVEKRCGKVDGPELAEGFLRPVADYQVNMIGEGGPGKQFFEWAADYGKLIADGRLPAPAELAEADWTRTRLLQGCQMDRGAAWYVRSEGASDGWAVRPPNGRHVLHYLSDTNDFTVGKKYRAFIRLRAEGLADDAADGELWSCEVGKAKLALNANQFRPGNWQTFEIGTFVPEGMGTPIKINRLWKHRDALKQVDVDCLWLVEEGD